MIYEANINNCCIMKVDKGSRCRSEEIISVPKRNHLYVLRPLKVVDFVCKERFGVSSDKKKQANMYTPTFLRIKICFEEEVKY